MATWSFLRRILSLCYQRIRSFVAYFERLYAYCWRNRSRDTVLAADAAPGDCLYRIRRHAHWQPDRIVYVWLKCPDLIPDEELRAFGPSVVRALSQLPAWRESWKTLTVSAENSVVQTQSDVFKPHSLPTDVLFEGYPFFDLLKLQNLKAVKSRTWSCLHHGRRCYLKTARFQFEVNALAREVNAYHALRNSDLCPNLVGYVYEESPDRVVGFLMEEIVGYHPTIDDLAPCEAALRKLHNMGIAHGDPHKYNIIIAVDGAKFIDFEQAALRDDTEEWPNTVQKEHEELRDKLLDMSGLGRPLGVAD
ncbi:hypothetical protein ED733_001826 [Metarhizium rileyi]|uniref:Protein kinase-like domain protein n=1 Tax=Metarhizium rileyi (strain RCEF 4871) TaxID=1649241 RepID=A0A5C6GCV6_METRR|nr:hypothetical protein ED733_001826 [Metarhizium rileyi]